MKIDKSNWQTYKVVFGSGDVSTYRCASEKEAWRAAWEDADGEDVLSVEVASDGSQK